jgi:ATP-dependent protease ClpP protease subunit
MKAGILAVLGLSLLALAGCKPAGPKGLSLREEPGRIVVIWNGAVEAPMHDQLEATFAHYENDPRQIVLALNSPGGSVQHGRDVMRLIHKVSHDRAIDTHVDAGNICASMCVPIYLVGAERSAHKAAKFMFHEVRFALRADTDQATRRQLSDPTIHRMAVNHFTNQLFGDDIGPRSVDAKWLEHMRSKIRGRDVWLTGRQLMEQGSGVVDKLL